MLWIVGRMTGSSRDNLTAFHDQLVIVKMTSFFVISLSIQYTTHYIVYYIIAADGHEGKSSIQGRTPFSECVSDSFG